MQVRMRVCPLCRCVFLKARGRAAARARPFVSRRNGLRGPWLGNERAFLPRRRDRLRGAGMGSRKIVTDAAAKLLRLPSAELFAKYASTGAKKVMETRDLARLFADCGIAVAGGDFDDEFRLADLKGDGVLTLDEFAVYHYGVLRTQAGLLAGLESVFKAYIAFGGKPDLFMDARALAHLCKDAKLIGDGLRLGDVDVIHSKVKTKGERKVSFEQFVYALALVAEARSETLDQVVASVVKSGPPKGHGTTETDKVRLHDDKDAYTWVYKRGGSAKVDGPALVNAGQASIKGRQEGDGRGADRGARAMGAGAGGDAGRGQGLSRQGSLARRDSLTESTGSVGEEEVAAMLEKASLRRVNEAISTKEDLPSQGEIRVELTPTGDMDTDLRNVFEAYNIFDGGDPDTMSGRAFVKIFRDRNMVQRNKGMTTQYLDLLFAKMKPKAQKRMGFRDFKAALEKIATEHKQMGMAEFAHLIIQGGGPTARGTIPDDVRHHDEAVYSAIGGRAPFESSQRPESTYSANSAVGSVTRGNAAASPSVDNSNVNMNASSPDRSSAVSMRRSVGGGVAASVDVAEMAVREAVPTEQRQWGEGPKRLYQLFQDYNLFGGRGDALNMDGRGFVKLCKEKGLLIRPLTVTDADMVFAAVRKAPRKTISFNEFCVAIAKLVERSQGSLPSFAKVMLALGKMGGPESTGTVGEPTKLYDNKEMWTGVALRGGPSTVGSGNAF